MICTCLQHKTLDELLQIAGNEGIELAEIRLDLCQLSVEEIERLFSEADIPLIATCRSGSDISEEEAFIRLSKAVEAGARFADLEIESRYGRELRSECAEHGASLIRSYHNFESTPGKAFLEEMAIRCLEEGDFAKIVTAVHDESDCRRIMSLYPRTNLIAFGMGELGLQTRIQCLKEGAPFTYASLTRDEATAPGQMTTEEIRIRCGFPIKNPGCTYDRMPSSKSLAQRAIIASALAADESVLKNCTPCEDTLSAVAVAAKLGAEISWKDGSTLSIKGRESEEESEARSTEISELNTGESGLLTRIMIPVISAINNGPCRFNGEKTLLERPLKGLASTLSQFGVEVTSSGKNKDEDSMKLPLTVEGRLHSMDASVSGLNGSQLISGLLFALPLVNGSSRIEIRNPRSIPYLRMTLDILSKFSIDIESDFPTKPCHQSKVSCGDCIAFRINGGQRYRAASFEIEGDWSSAAMFLVAGALYGSVRILSLNTDTLQGDSAIIDILKKAGAFVRNCKNGGVRVGKAPLNSFDADLNDTPDLFPAVALLAALSNGGSRLKGVKRLSAKESDRAGAIKNMLQQMGVPCSICDDTMTIEGESLSTRTVRNKLLNGGHYTSSHDHRMAMVLETASLAAQSPIIIDDVQCIGKSFPEFPACWQRFCRGTRYR